MSDAESTSSPDTSHRSYDHDVTPPARKRPKPGERRVQILQALVSILERGTHAQLLASGGCYASMWALQQSSE